MTNTDALLTAARIAYPEYEWKVHAESIVYTDDILEYGESKQFKPELNDSDWVRLREGLDHKGFTLRPDLPNGNPEYRLCPYSLAPGLPANSPAWNMTHKDPRQLAIMICGVIADE